MDEFIDNDFYIICHIILIFILFLHIYYSISKDSLKKKLITTLVPCNLDEEI